MKISEVNEPKSDLNEGHMFALRLLQMAFVESEQVGVFIRTNIKTGEQVAVVCFDNDGDPIPVATLLELPLPEMISQRQSKLVN